MSSALKALKKLRKKAAKHESKIKAGDRALRQLSRPNIQSPNSHSKPTQSIDSVWSEISQQVVGSVLSEATKPLKPLLDWFDHSGAIVVNVQGKSVSQERKAAPTLNGVRMSRDTSSVPAILRLPFKSPPCKRCPARSGGVCQCAAKRFA